MFALLWRVFWLRQAFRLFRAIRREPGLLRDRRTLGPVLWLLLFRHHRWAPVARRMRYF
jgi:hypothetical protein